MNLDDKDRCFGQRAIFFVIISLSMVHTHLLILAVTFSINVIWYTYFTTIIMHYCLGRMD